MGYYADLIKQKQERKNSYAKLVKKLSDFDIYEDAEGYFMRVKDGKLLKGGYLSIRDAETDGHRAKSASKDNEKENADYSKYLTAEEMEYLKKVDFPSKHDVRAQKIFEKYVRAKNKEEGINNEDKVNAIEYKTISQKEWDDLKRHGYTDVIGGIKYALIAHPTKGTILSPVKINEKGYYEQIIEQKNSFEEEYSKLMFKMKRMQSDPKTTWSQMEDLNREISELKKKYGKPNNYRMTNEKRNFGDEVLIEKKSFGEYWYSIYQTKNKMILRVYTPYGMYYIDDIRDLADGRNEAQRTIDIVKKAGRYV